MQALLEDQIALAVRFLRTGSVPAPIITLLGRSVKDPEAFLAELERRVEMGVLEPASYREFRLAFGRQANNSGVVTIRLPPDIRTRLKHYANQFRLSESEALRVVLDEALPHDPAS